MRVSGLAPVEGIPGLENIDVTKLVNGHMAYRAAMPRLLREVGWEVESDEFTEIEDPDPENHEKRQRELIRELDEARKEAEVKPGKRRFGFFKKGKLAEKKGWETYDDSMRKGDDWGTGNAEGGGNILFDIEAIKAELHSEQIEVKQLESTLPPLKLNQEEVCGSRAYAFSHSRSIHGFLPQKRCLTFPGLEPEMLTSRCSQIDKARQGPYSNLRETKSYDAVQAPVQERRTRGSQSTDLNEHSSQTSLPNGHKENPFDTGYDEYSLPAEAANIPGSAEHSMLSFGSSLASPSPHRARFSMDSPQVSPSLRETAESTPPPQRFPLRSSLTMPPSNSDIGLDHNAWYVFPSQFYPDRCTI